MTISDGSVGLEESLSDMSEWSVKKVMRRGKKEKEVPQEKDRITEILDEKIMRS